MAKACVLAEICEVEDSVLSGISPSKTRSSTCTLLSGSKSGKIGAQKALSLARVRQSCWRPLGKDSRDVSSPRCVSEMASNFSLLDPIALLLAVVAPGTAKRY